MLGSFRRLWDTEHNTLMREVAGLAGLCSTIIVGLFLPLVF